MLSDFLAIQLYAINTTFNKKSQRKQVSRDGRTRNEIDYVIAVTDVTAFHYKRSN